MTVDVTIQQNAVTVAPSSAITVATQQHEVGVTATSTGVAVTVAPVAPTIRIDQGVAVTVAPATAQLTVAPGAPPLTVQEIDGSPTVNHVTTLRVSNGTLTNDGAGQVTITTGGGGGGNVAHLDTPNTFTAENLFTTSVGIGNRADPTEGGGAVDVLAIQETLTTMPDVGMAVHGVQVDLIAAFPDVPLPSLVAGLNFRVRTDPTSPVAANLLFGMLGVVEHRGSAFFNNAYGLSGAGYNFGDGSIGELNGIEVDVANYSGTGTVGIVRGIHIDPAFDSGPVSTRVGLDIDSQLQGVATVVFALRTQGGETRHSTGSPTTVGLSIQRDPVQTADLLRILDSDGTTILQRTNANGYDIISRTSAPADSELNPNECAFWFDPTPGNAKLMIKAKDSAGTVVTGQVALT